MISNIPTILLKNIYMYIYILIPRWSVIRRDIQEFCVYYYYYYCLIYILNIFLVPGQAATQEYLHNPHYRKQRRTLSNGKRVVDQVEL